MDNVGEILKNARLDKVLSLEQVEEATSIRKSYLVAIEAGDYEKIPGDVFTKGIIRTYGNYLGLNGPELVTIYKAARAGVNPEEVKPVEIRSTSKISVAPQLQPQKSSRNIFTYFIALVLLSAVAATGYLFLLRSGDKPIDSVTPKQSSLEDEKTSVQNKNTDQTNAKIEADAKKAKERAEQAALDTQVKQEKDSKKTQPGQAIAKVDGVNLYMFCNDRCWVEVIADGKTVFEGTLVSNQEKSFFAEEKIAVKYGNIKAMQIAVNGTPVPAEKLDGVVFKEYKK